ncbi:MAG: nitric oxide reductase activation protein NorD [Thiothrix sp.]|nr:nitric oxide reductase activation protein NorD [Thiothrix sp.]HPQ94572.1 nitric oxide reductase activation protein NorD [Thiolinea sp.]
MSITIDDYQDLIRQLAPGQPQVLEALFQDAARIMSPAGLADYLEGARGLLRLGRGPGLVLNYLESLPPVVRECGEDVIRDVLSAAMKLSSMVSGEVVGLMFASLPVAARRLGDAQLLRSYLQLLHQLSAKAPRGLRPMLNHMDELLGKLTLGGLRRWALFGAEAYRRDLANLSRYFDLETQDSRAMIRKERRGTLFIDNQRKLNFYLRALWGRDFFLRPAAADVENFRPYLQDRILHLPDAVDAIGDIPGLEVYRATAAHMAAHLMYTRTAISMQELSPAQMFFIGLVEDARVEYHAVLAFPGLKKLWGSLLGRVHDTPVEHASLLLLEKVAHALLDAGVRVGDEALDAVVARFHAEIVTRAMDNRLAWHLGLDLFNILARRREVPSLRLLEKIRITYRDDNRFVWSSEAFAGGQEGTEYLPASQRQVRKYVSAIEMANEVDVENAGDDAQEVWICATEFFPYEDQGVSYNEMWGKEPVSDPFHYHEWDYQVQLHRPDWATLYERRPRKAAPDVIDRILLEYRPVAFRIRQIIDLLQPEGVQRQRRLEDGDEIDINAAIDAMVAMRMGSQPDTRITMRNVIRRRDLAVLVLLDLSESTNEKMQGSDKTVLELTREATALVATAISGIGDPFAIHGFSSDGRHDVQYYRFKDFREPFDEAARSRLAGMSGQLSTRMGAAMRHAGQHLLRQPERRKLLLLVTDGEPADIDERDPQYLRLDARKAVEELYPQGVLSYCLTLDRDADEYVKRIFGQGRYTIVDHVERLPEQLPLLFASLTR